MLRIDDESTMVIDDALKSNIIAEAKKRIPESGAVILSDYGKGRFQANDLTETIVISPATTTSPWQSTQRERSGSVCRGHMCYAQHR